MRHWTTVAVPGLLLAAWQVAAIAQPAPGTEYVGKLNAQLVPSRRPNITPRLRTCTDEERATLPAKLSAADKAFCGMLNWAGTKPDGSKRGPKDGIRVMLVEPAKHARFVYVDANGDGVVSSPERFVFSDKPNPETGRVETVVPLEERGLYRFYPIVLSQPPPVAADPPAKPDERYLFQSVRVFAETIVNVAGRPTLVAFAPGDGGTIDPRNGLLGIDGDGDGKLDPSFTSAENAYAKDEEVVFRAGDRYVSVKRVDQKSGTVTLVEHPASDYERIEMRVGAQVPDFEFVDFSGAARRLSDFRGKYVLLDFWGTWCGPCVGEIPFLTAAYEAYRNRGFEIIGIDGELPDDTDEDLARGLEKAKAFVAAKGVLWTQATPASIKNLYARRFRVTAWPTTILLDPDGKILSTGGKEAPLRGDDLKATLEKMLPPSRVRPW